MSCACISTEEGGWNRGGHQANMWDDSEFGSKDLRHVGNYTLGRMIGKGSFGKVYLATHKLTNGSKVCDVGGLRDQADSRI